MHPAPAMRRGERLAWLGVLPLALYLTLTGAGASNGVYLQAFRLVSLSLLLAAFAVWTILAIRVPSTRPTTTIPLALLLPLGALTLATSTSVSPRVSVEFLGYAVALVALYLLLVLILRQPALASRLLVMLALVTATLSFVYIVTIAQTWMHWWSLVGRVAIPPLRPGYEAITYGAPGILSAFLILGAASSCSGLVLMGRGGRALAIILALLTGPAILLAAARGAWLGLAVGSAAAALAALWAGWRPPIPGSHRARALAGLAAAGVLVVAAMMGPSILRRFVFGGGSALRETLAATAVRMFEERPLTGAGPGAWVMLRGSQTAPGEVDYYIPHAHNVPVQVLAESGLVGAAAGLCAALVIGLLIARALRAPDVRRRMFGVTAVFAVVYLGVHQLVDSFMDMPAVLFAAAMPIAILDALDERPLVGTSPTVRRALIPAIALATVTATVFFVALPATKFQQAVDSFRAGEADQAFAELGPVLIADPTLPAYRFLEGLVAADRGDAATARDAFRAVARADDFPHAWLNLAALELEANDQAAARMAISNALRLGRQQVGVAVPAGTLLLELGAQTEAVDAFAAALTTAPSLADDPWWQADERRRSAWREAVDRITSGTDVRSAFAVALFAGDTSTARIRAAALPDVSRDFALLTIDAWTGDIEAIAGLRTMVERDPFATDAMAWLARIAARSGDVETRMHYRELAQIIWGVPDVDVGDDVIVAKQPTQDAQLPGPNANYHILYTYRLPMVWDILIDDLPVVTLG